MPAGSAGTRAQEVGLTLLRKTDKKDQVLLVLSTFLVRVTVVKRQFYGKICFLIQEALVIVIQLLTYDSFEILFKQNV